MSGTGVSGRRFKIGLVALLLLGFALRVAYVVAQPSHDPAFARPMLDGAYYLEWARALAAGGTGPAGAFYLAPLYPYLLSGFLQLAGESFAALYLIQHALLVAAAGLLGAFVRRTAGDAAGLAAAALFLFHHPILYFGSRPLGEPVALLLLCLALFLVDRDRSGPLAGGLGLGLASLARPNLLLIAFGWLGADALRRRWRRTAWLLAGLTLVILPVTARNLSVSGHLVPVSANAGITLYHGNGPGARGVYTPADGFSGTLTEQREEATRLASLRTAMDLDPVQADRWWGGQAVRERLRHPGGTAGLLAWKLLLVLDNAEHGLDYPPALDLNPWRWGAPVTFSFLIGLAGAGVVLRGWSGTGGDRLWMAILASAATPVVFYLSSRYRLPMTALLAAPAGVGLVALFHREEWSGLGRFLAALATGLTLVVASLFLPRAFEPSGRQVLLTERAAGLANRAASYVQVGDTLAAERDARRALQLDPRVTLAHYNLAVVLERTGRTDEAMHHYGQVVSRQPSHAEAAGNLGKLLIESGRPAEAVPILVRALESRMMHRVCWTNLIVARTLLGDLEQARENARQAITLGLEIDPGLLEEIGLSVPGDAESKAAGR